MRVEEGFQQLPFSDDEPYGADPVLFTLLKRLFPKSVHAEVDADLRRLERETIPEIRALSNLATPPYLTQYNQWGQRVDILHTSEGWRGLKAAVQKEGVVAISYDRKHGEHSRIHAFVKMLLMSGDGQVVFCPIAMTDGCARVLELFGTPAMQKDVFPRLVSRDPSTAFTAGQWMTERPGGSDVSQTETTAAPSSEITAHPLGPVYKLDGFKWFSSATDSNVSVALARTGSLSQGSRGLSLFLVPLRLPLVHEPPSPLPPSTSNNIYVHRLKNKIGTHILPTAELSLNGTEGYLLGPQNQGVRCIAPVLNITRVHSAIGSVGALRKCLAIASSFATVRAVNGGKQMLVDTPLHVAELAKISLVYRALVHLTFGAVHLLGKTECGTASKDEELRFRLLTPIIKGFAAEKAVSAMEECMSSMGGQGYMEENMIGSTRLIRDSLVEKIWEGTITVLSLDLLRTIQIKGALKSFIDWAEMSLASVPDPLKMQIEEPLSLLRTGLEELQAAYKQPVPMLVPRPAFMLFAHVASGFYLLEHAVWSYNKDEAQRDVDIEAFCRWIIEGGLKAAREDVKRAKITSLDRSNMDSALVYGSRTKAKL
ncbi:hypothetical protein EW146_g1919 [Bondarzewia mesenterica]|uniref:Acyl-CoA dehydrogenase/oxidase C-terminal domain-containing protein n=1 Tax=Bondarzewia mesenterica TaxID=1095465 RepID=A0A4S4M2G2_9AGAM|nr:hypothetical protein EW146_g1919 [Bondarzewia mesenterica]